MKKILIGLGVIVLLLVIAFFVPSTYTVERSVVIKAEPAAIHPYINSLQRWPEWSAWTKEAYPTIVYSYEGPVEGVGSGEQMGRR